MSTILKTTLHQLSEQLRNRDVSSVEVTRFVLNHIAEKDSSIGAFITVCGEEAMQQAEAADNRLKNGDQSPLCGVPVSLKDLLCTRGIETTCGSRILKGFHPPYDATVVELLKKAGAVIVGKVAMDEFAMGSSSETCAYTIPRNPWNTDHVCGGSSGGSAASVASGECYASLGSDTGGSIRQPASHCGVVGMKPTYGRVSRYGLIAFASSLDQVGPFTKDIRDCAIMMNCIAGHDPRDATSINIPVPDYTKALTQDVAGLTVGVPKEYFVEGLDTDVEKTVRHGIRVLEEGGATIKEVSLPRTDTCVAVYYIIAPAEASSNLARYDGVRFGLRDTNGASLAEMYRLTRSQGFGAEVKRRILLGTYALSSGYYDAYYKKASQVRTVITDDFRKIFSTCDLLVSPVAPTTAWKLGEKADNPLSMYLSDILTISANLAGIPAVSIPAGFSAHGLPVGIQLQAAHFKEEVLFRSGSYLEKHLSIPFSP